jgi:hypothetical protein
MGLLLTKICIVVAILFIWFETNFVFYYYELLMNKPLDVPEHLSYPEYLYVQSCKEKRFKKFFLKAFSCYKCIALWLSSAVTLDVDCFSVYIIVYNKLLTIFKTPNIRKFFIITYIKKPKLF